MAHLGNSVVNGGLKVVGNTSSAGVNSTEPICVSSRTGGSWNEGIRVDRSANQWACFVIGGPMDSTSGNYDNQWLIAVPPTGTATRRLIIAHGSISSQSTTYFYASSASDAGASLQIGGNLTVNGTINGLKISLVT